VGEWQRITENAPDSMRKVIVGAYRYGVGVGYRYETEWRDCLRNGEPMTWTPTHFQDFPAVPNESD
jgi:hypothetical protein